LPLSFGLGFPFKLDGKRILQWGRLERHAALQSPEEDGGKTKTFPVPSLVEERPFAG
jgi:hypothetical protein